MLKRILVPLDGSLVAEQAIPTAGHLARTVGGTVVLVRAVSPPTDDDYEAFLLASASVELHPLIQRARKSALQYLKNVAVSSELAEVNTEIVTIIGQASAVIAAVAESRDIDLIVMGSHDNTDLSHCILGSVAQMLTRHASVPVLVLRQQAHAHASFPSTTSDRPLRVLIPLDGSVQAEAVLTPTMHLVAALAATGQGTIHLVRVVKPTAVSDRSLGMAEEVYPLHQAQAYLSSVAETLRLSIAAECKLTITWSVVSDTNIAHAIIKTATGSEALKEIGASESYDLIALATHGRLGFQFLEMGSVAAGILAGTRLPVFIVQAKATAGRQVKRWEEASVSKHLI